MAVEPGGIGYVVARAGELDAGHSHENFLLLIGYWITPFLGVILADYWLRRGPHIRAEIRAGEIVARTIPAQHTVHWNGVDEAADFLRPPFLDSDYRAS